MVLVSVSNPHVNGLIKYISCILKVIEGAGDLEIFAQTK